MEIVKASLLGKPFTDLAKEYGCTPSTITRTVKGLLSEDQYAALKKARIEGNFEKEITPLQLEEVKEFQEQNRNESFRNDSQQEDQFLEDHQFNRSTTEPVPTDSVENDHQDQFPEVIPFISGFEWEEQKEVAAKPFSIELLPEIVYMLVDKKVELEFKPLKEFSQWSFLPDKDQERLAILLFSNQRQAKRHCSRNQRVLKVPNTDVFRISSSFLISKGITRLVLDDSLIALDTLTVD